MNKRPSVEQFRQARAALVKTGQVALYRQLLERYKHLTQAEREAMIEQFKRDALEAQCSPKPSSE
jgi:hypothetical protein